MSVEANILKFVRKTTENDSYDECVIHMNAVNLEKIDRPQGLGIGIEGNVYVSDQSNHRILVFKPTV